MVDMSRAVLFQKRRSPRAVCDNLCQAAGLREKTVAKSTLVADPANGA